MHVAPLPSQEALQAYYAEQYRLEYKGVLRPKPYHVIRAAAAAYDRIAWLLPHLPASGRWLDVGAGSGEFAYLLRRKGLAVTALEPNRDPVAALGRMRRLLRPNGLMAVEVPNAAFPLVHPKNRFHPAHLVHFNFENLELATRLAGLETVEMRTSADRGVLWGVFRNSARDLAIPPISPDRVAAWQQAERCRARWRYYANPAIWARTGKRLVKLAAERRLGRRFPSPERYLAQMALPE